MMCLNSRFYAPPNCMVKRSLYAKKCDQNDFGWAFSSEEIEDQDFDVAGLITCSFYLKFDGVLI